MYRDWRETVTGPRGGVSYAYATGAWEVGGSNRINIEDVCMRPDMPFPTYQENGLVYKNTYRRPQHVGNGDIEPWLEFMRHLLPVETEREWFCSWLAHKHRHPAIPGAGVIMVAASPEGPVYGTGRGLLRDIIARLLGPKYVRPIDFDIFTGKSSQGVFTDFGAYALMVTVNEARDNAESGRWSERRAIYERLKEIVDPRAIERTFTSKGKPAFQARSCASYLIASNNRDALQIPPDDRRIAALVNGERMPAQMAAGLEAWMDAPGNIAELARWLERRDLGNFNAYEAPETAAKKVMQELARTDLDDAWSAVKRRIGPKGLFTGELIRTAMQEELSDYTMGDEIKRWLRRRIRAEAVRVKDYRLSPAQGRHWILSWRDYDDKLLPSVSESAARSAVETTTRALLGTEPSTIGATILGLKHPSGDDGDDNKNR
jgi:hypothetical protein